MHVGLPSQPSLHAVVQLLNSDWRLHPTDWRQTWLSKACTVSVRACPCEVHKTTLGGKSTRKLACTSWLPNGLSLKRVPNGQPDAAGTFVSCHVGAPSWAPPAHLATTCSRSFWDPPSPPPVQTSPPVQAPLKALRSTWLARARAMSCGTPRPEDSGLGEGKMFSINSSKRFQKTCPCINNAVYFP